MATAPRRGKRAHLVLEAIHELARLLRGDEGATDVDEGEAADDDDEEHEDTVSLPVGDDGGDCKEATVGASEGIIRAGTASWATRGERGVRGGAAEVTRGRAAARPLPLWGRGRRDKWGDCDDAYW